MIIAVRPFAKPIAADPIAARRSLRGPVASVCLGAVLGAVLGLAPSTVLAADVLQPQRVFAALHRPVPIEIVAEAPGERSLSMQRHDGTELLRIDAVASGTIDLGATLPEIWTLERSVWVQLLVDGTPLGTPLVVQPLRERPPMRTTTSTRPDGTTRYTRIVGWGDEPLDPVSETDRALAHGWSAAEVRPISGVRVVVDRDVVLETMHGTIRIGLRPDEAPNTAWNFRELVEGGLYDGTVFHRVVPLDRAGHPFVVQGGDPSRSGLGGPGRTLPMEPSRLAHDFGVVSMARADDPDSAGSQFFICLSREGTARLDGQYCAFGEVVDGIEAVLAIAETEIGDPASGRPVDPPPVLRAALVPAPSRTPGSGRPDRRIERPRPAAEERTPSGHDPR